MSTLDHVSEKPPVVKVRYRGSPGSIRLFDSLLRDEGLQVDHRQIVEQPGVQQDIVDVVMYVADPDVDVR